MSVEDTHSSDHELDDSDFDDNLAKELSEARLARKQIENKYKLLKQRYEEELTTFDEARVEHILKNSGAKDYIETLKERSRAKDELVRNLEQEAKYLRKEVDHLRERCSRSEKRTDLYYKAWRESQAKNDRLNEMSTREQSMNHERMFNDTSPALSFDTSHAVPPPPLIEMPSLDEILNTVESPPVNEQPSYTSVNNSHYSHLDQLNSPIPPPPLVNVSIEDIIGGLGSPQGSVYSNERRY